jgi:hypothetical protein
MAAYHKSDLTGPAEPVSLKQPGQLARVHLAPALVEQDHKRIRLYGSQDGLTLFFNDPPSLGARVVTVAKLKELGAGEPFDSPQIIFDHRPDGIALRFTYPHKA